MFSLKGVRFEKDDDPANIFGVPLMMGKKYEYNFTRKNNVLSFYIIFEKVLLKTVGSIVM